MQKLIKAAVPLLLVLWTIPGLKAQVKDYGVRGGVQAAMFHKGAEIYEGALNAFYAGLYADRAILMSGFLSFSPGMEYVQAGHQSDADSFRRIHYLSIPLGVRAHFGPWFLQTGLSANFRLTEKLMEDNLVVLNDANRTDLFDLPVQAGAGVTIANITLEGRLNLGFLDVNQGYSSTYLQVGLGIGF